MRVRGVTFTAALKWQSNEINIVGILVNTPQSPQLNDHSISNALRLVHELRQLRPIELLHTHPQLKPLDRLLEAHHKCPNLRKQLGLKKSRRSHDRNDVLI